MTHQYRLTGMTCGYCEKRVKTTLLLLEEVRQVVVSKEKETATITMNQHIPISKIQKQLTQIGEQYVLSPLDHSETVEVAKSWFATYRPILLIFTYLFGITFLIELTAESIQIMRWMQHFMAGFFLTFSFFKLLNLKGFKESYMMYDVIARQFPIWGYLYAFIELGLGIAYLLYFSPLLTNIVAFIVMSISIIGVLQTVLNKNKIQCACLGDVFNLPMSTVTIIEDGLMIVMSAYMIFHLL